MSVQREKPIRVVIAILKMKANGFTLIELLVSVLIFSLLSMSGLVAFVSFREERLAAREAQKVTDNLREAERRAVAGDKPVECGSFKMTAYRVTMTSNSISTSAVCPGGLPPTTTESLRQGVIRNPQSIDFFVLKGGASGESEIEVCSFERLYRISVSSAGGVSRPVKDPVGCAS